jgi:predicted amidohydrolase
MYDLLLKGGRVIDAASGLDGVLDVAVGRRRSRGLAAASRRVRPRGASTSTASS